MEKQVGAEHPPYTIAKDRGVLTVSKVVRRLRIAGRRRCYADSSTILVAQAKAVPPPVFHLPNHTCGDDLRNYVGRPRVNSGCSALRELCRRLDRFGHRLPTSRLDIFRMCHFPLMSGNGSTDK